jgi:acetyl-CoA carboxylase biotin carboxyl carrier protein
MSHTVAAELVANVFQVLVEVGDRVQATDTLVILESMKMEIPVPADVAGVVSEVAVRPGDNISEGDVIAVIDTA